jgi:hypothetical protein
MPTILFVQLVERIGMLPAHTVMHYAQYYWQVYELHSDMKFFLNHMLGSVFAFVFLCVLAIAHIRKKVVDQTKHTYKYILYRV